MDGSAREIGQHVEEMVRDYLQGQGLTLLEQNYHCRQGEIDLIMRDNEALVFVEVRYRRHSRYGNGAETVDARKQRRLITAAQHYLQAHPSQRQRPCRFDVVSVTTEAGDYRLQWLQNAIEL